MLIDTHAHIHFDDFKDNLTDIFTAAHQAQLEAIICVGTDDEDSRRALNFVTNPDVIQAAQGIKLFATAGIHPHEANLGEDAFLSVKELCFSSDYEQVLVAIGECGLDYFKNLSPRAEQLRMLEMQIELALDQDLPLVFHVRDAWEDFFGVLKNYPKLRGVVHSFTGHPAEVERALEYELYFGLNGIMTFTKDEAQLEAAKLIPAERLLLETDCPFLSPTPMRGQLNQPAYLRYIAEFLAQHRGVLTAQLASTSTHNAQTLFRLEK